MARSNNRKRGNYNTPSRRLLSNTINKYKPRPLPSSLYELDRLFTDIRNESYQQYTDLNLELADVEDRRMWHPDSRLRAFKRVDGLNTEYNNQNTNLLNLAFDMPEKVLICVRRKVRREVLHAFRKTGKGSGKSRKTNLSDIFC